MSEKLRHPRELPVLFFTEMWERFSFYLMLGILPLYLSDSQKGGMGWTDAQAAVLVGSYIALVYFTPFIGGLLADRLLGCRKTIVIGAVLMMIGHLVLAVPNELGLYLGLGFLILGNGAFKPNISTLLGNLYPPGSPLKDSGYNIFYMGINIGAFICNFVAMFVRNHFDEHPLRVTSTWEIGGWHAAFATAALGMLIGLVTFSLNYRRFAAVDPDPRTDPDRPRESLTPFWVQCLGPAAALGGIGALLALYVKGFPFNAPTAAFLGACIPVIIFYVNIWRGVPDAADRGRVAALLVIFTVVIVFWMTFHLSSTALNVWTRDNTDRVIGFEGGWVKYEDLAENAPPDYFNNAGPDVPRPDRDTFVVVSDAKYKAMEKAMELRVVEGEKVYVTQAMLDKIYADSNTQTPALPPGKHLKLVNTELFQSINAGFVILFTPLLVGIWHLLRLRGLEPSTPAKIGLGLFFSALGMLVMYGATLVSHDGQAKASASWLFGYYGIVTVGELCLSPMGLSLVNKMSPGNIRAFMMGGWFLATSFGNKLSGIFGEVYHQMDHRTFWILLFGLQAAFAGIIFVLLPWLNRQMATPSEPQPDGPKDESIKAAPKQS